MLQLFDKYIDLLAFKTLDFSVFTLHKMFIPFINRLNHFPTIIWTICLLVQTQLQVNLEIFVEYFLFSFLAI